MRISYSQVKAFQKCQRAWQYSRMWESRKPSKAMELGTLLHSSLTAWWTGSDYVFPITDFEKAQFALRAEEDPAALPMEMAREIVDTAKWLMGRYAQVYSRDGVQVLECDTEHIVPIGKIVVGDVTDAHYEVVDLVFKPDMIFVYQGQRAVYDFKSGTKFSAAEIIDLSPQLTDYALGLWLEGQPADLLCYDMLRTYRWRRKGEWDDKNHPPHESFQRHWTTREPEQLERHRAELLKTAEQMFLVQQGGIGAVRAWSEATCPRCFFKAPCFEYALGGEMGEMAILQESYNVRERFTDQPVPVEVGD